MTRCESPQEMYACNGFCRENPLNGSWDQHAHVVRPIWSQVLFLNVDLEDIIDLTVGVR
jgi:hypothetical protein